MGSMEKENQLKTTKQQEEDCLHALQLVTGSVMPLVMQQAMELDLFETMAKAGEGANLSASEISSRLCTKNPEAPMMIDRILRLLASYSVLIPSITTRDNGHLERVYSLAPVCKYLLRDQDGVCLSSWLRLTSDKINNKTMSGLKDTVMEGGMTFSRVHGVNLYEYFEKDPEMAKVFDRAMVDHTSIIMKQILEAYQGFEDLNLVVDVAGGIGTMSNLITSKYPTISCINFDLPRVVQYAPSYPRVKHVGGDMFVNVPNGDAIFLKWIIHNWSDEDCVALLKKCYEAVPDNGKVIVVDAVIPEVPESNTAAKGICQLDLLMMVNCPGGRERTQREFEYLGKEAGFCGIKLACFICNYGLFEFYKTI